MRPLGPCASGPSQNRHSCWLRYFYRLSICSLLPMDIPETSLTSAFDKARTGLWVNLQKHLVTVYEADVAFARVVAFAATFPFATSSASSEQLDDYWRGRRALRDLFTDETTQLDTLTKAIRGKAYAEAEKKQLYLLLLGYMDIATTVFERLQTQVPTSVPKDEELEETSARFMRVQNFARLNVKGIVGLMR